MTLHKVRMKPHEAGRAVHVPKAFCDVCGKAAVFIAGVWWHVDLRYVPSGSESVIDIPQLPGER